ncbi:hypothetical protein BDZ94DRAFT_1194975 [Collybia nuda]|uniref:UBC core domain-containing protein n=1 Tax=Collybia nuda TaxID=64659 RepID=A0A9P5Y2J0_9AGAR|nr:hypothetical protein BDZ94DRAFT_1194975 [Collybia nuda]
MSNQDLSSLDISPKGSESSSPTSTKFYQQDIVQRVVSPNSIGIVLRCWHDAEDVPPPSPISDPMMRPLNPGEVGVSFLNDGGEREILLETQLRLVDRTLQPGDFCKRSIDDLRSGVVTNVHVKGHIEHVISGESIGWRTLEELEDRVDAEIGDYVVYDDWIGQVIEVRRSVEVRTKGLSGSKLYDEATVEVASGHLIHLPELSSRLSVGEKGSDILPPAAGGVHNFFGFLMGPPPTGGADTVVAIKHTVYAVAWLAVNQSLGTTEAERKKRPQRFWYGEDVGDLTIIRGRSDLEMRVGDRVHMRDTKGLPVTRHGQEGDGVHMIDVQTFMVTETRTTLHILWQDGTQETISSTAVIPYLNPDEYDCWPGDHVVWKTEDVNQPAIVQHVKAADRTATILLAESGLVELVSVLELDPHGTSDMASIMPESASEELGVRRGDFVFIHREGTTNGFKKPCVPRIGELEAWVREGPFLEGRLSGWRKEMSDIGSRLAAHHGEEHYESKFRRPSKGDGPMWLGEVTNLNLDGTVEVTHPDWTVRVYPLDRLTKLYDGIEQLEDDLWGDEASDTQESYADNEGQIWAMNEEGTWQPNVNGNEWEEYDNNGDDDDDMEGDDSMDTDHLGWAEEPLNDGSSDSQLVLSGLLPIKEHQPSADVDVHTTPPQLSESDFINKGKDNDIQSKEFPYKRFDILSSAPLDHAFFTSLPAQPSKSFLGRLTREYRVLATSLPDTIFVRAYEDRTDLLRCLILGPENTPYEDAPFMIDWMLDSNFPNAPPIAHFHSWTNGNGRVNPNLYEEGKVCLSILGTWAGDRNETWSAARSSLLQAFISIQGLVLVKEPWFCEPAYDKLRGTEEGIVNSRLYNEKAYVLSRGFVKRALEVPLGGLEAEVRWIYHQNHRLQKVVRDARELIRKSTTNSIIPGEEHDRAVPRLTAGGIITLERTLGRLQTLLNSTTLRENSLI